MHRLAHWPRPLTLLPHGPVGGGRPGTCPAAHSAGPAEGCSGPRGQPGLLCPEPTQSPTGSHRLRISFLPAPCRGYTPPPHCGPCLSAVSLIPSCFTLKPDCKRSPSRATDGRGPRARTGAWRVCALMGSGAEPAGCVAPLPRERALKCVPEPTRGTLPPARPRSAQGSPAGAH